MTLAFVTDTHPLIFHAQGGGKLGKKAKAIFAQAEEQQAIIYVPAVVLWEVSILVRIGRIDLRRSLRAFSDDLFSNAAYQMCELSLEQVLVASEDTPPNLDPFDTLIGAVARELELPLITRDAALCALSDLCTVW